MILKMIARAIGEVSEAIADLQSLTDSRAFAATARSDAKAKARFAAQLMAIAATLDPAMEAPAERLYTATEAAERFGVTKAAVLARVRAGTLTSVIVGEVGQRCLRIPESAIWWNISTDSTTEDNSTGTPFQ